MYANNVRSQANSSVQNRVSGWDDVIRFTQVKIKRLKKAVEGFKAAKKRGDPWPGIAEASANANDSQQHGD